MTHPNDLDDILVQLNDGSPTDARFEVSTVQQVLSLLGVSREEIKNLSRDQHDNLDWAWFNSRAYLQLHCGSGRDFRFNFEDFYLRPTRHPIVQAALAWRTQEGLTETCPWLFVFNVYGHGRMVATTLPLETVTHIHVATREGRLNVAPLRETLASFSNH